MMRLKTTILTTVLLFCASICAMAQVYQPDDIDPEMQVMPDAYKNLQTEKEMKKAQKEIIKAEKERLKAEKKLRKAEKRKNRKSLKEHLQTADSLRLAMRRAADSGRMLQWGDSLLRTRLDSGFINKKMFVKLRSRLAKYDRKLFMGDSLLASNYKKAKFDTAYIERPDARWTIKLRGNFSGGKIQAKGVSNGTAFDSEVRSEYRGTMAVAVAYRGLALGVALNPAKLAGKSKDNEFNLNSYSNRYGFDIVYLNSKTYHGYASTANGRVDINRGMVNQKALNINAYYAFNGRKFSMPAAFTQSYIQKKSAGSFMLGMSFDGQITDVSKDAGISDTDTKLKIVELGIGAGYGYNLVAGKHLLFHLDCLPTIDVLAVSKISQGDEEIKLHYRFPSVIITGRGSATYSWRNKFLGVMMVYNYSTIGNEEHLQIGRDKWRMRAYFGFRF